jgi:hypothetical protein
LRIDHAGELPRAEAPQVGGKEIHLRAPQPVAQHRVVGDFLQVLGEAGVVQLAQVSNSWQVSQRVPVSRL